MYDINQEYADLYEKYGYLWADAFNKAQGRGWILQPNNSRSMLERNRIFVDLVKKGYAVHTEEKYGFYYIYTLKLPETGGREITQEYTDLYEKYGPVWAEAFNKARGRGWSLLPIRPRTTDEGFRVFVEYAKKGYEVYVEPRNNEYFIYVMKQVVASGRVSERYVSESRTTPKEWQDMSFDPARIAAREKSVQVVQVDKNHVEALKKIVREYRMGYADAATAIKDMVRIVERM